MPLPLSLLARFAGHGAEQKFGDELATTADKPLTEEDMVLAIDDLNAQIQSGKWGAGRASSGGGGVCEPRPRAPQLQRHTRTRTAGHVRASLTRAAPRWARWTWW